MWFDVQLNSVGSPLNVVTQEFADPLAVSNCRSRQITSEKWRIVRSLDCNYGDGLCHSVHSTWRHSHCQRKSKKHSLLASSVGNPDDIEPFNRQYNSHVPSATFQNTQPVTSNVPPEQTKTCHWTQTLSSIFIWRMPSAHCYDKGIVKLCKNDGSVFSHLA